MSILNDLLKSSTTALSDRLLYGGETANELALQRERNANNQLNGSGAVSQSNTATSPMGLFDFLFGDPNTRKATNNVTPGGGNWLKLGLVAAVVIGIGYFLWKKV